MCLLSYCPSLSLRKFNYFATNLNLDFELELRMLEKWQSSLSDSFGACEISLLTYVKHFFVGLNSTLSR